jgi:hypothetical protein
MYRAAFNRFASAIFFLRNADLYQEYFSVIVTSHQVGDELEMSSINPGLDIYVASKISLNLFGYLLSYLCFHSDKDKV